MSDPCYVGIDVGKDHLDIALRPSGPALVVRDVALVAAMRTLRVALNAMIRDRRPGDPALAGA